MTGTVDSEALLRSVTLLAAIGAGLTAGVFLAFSTFVTTGLGRAADPVGLQAMQEINLAAPTPVFMMTLFGTAVLAIGLAVAAIVGRGAGWALVVAGTAVYLVCVALTIGYHVPRNEALALLDPAADGSSRAWRDYLVDWTRMNHVRTITATLGCVLLVLSRGTG